MVLWAEACPFASSSTASLSTTGLNVLCVQKTLTLTLNGGGVESKWVLWGKNGAWGDATCTCPRTCVSRPCSSLCMVTRVLALQVWLSICLMVSGREDLSLHSVGSIQAVDDYPNYTWDGLTLNLFCSTTFTVNVTHKQQHRFTFQQMLAIGNYFNNPNSTWFKHVRNPSATINRTINLNNHIYVKISTSHKLLSNHASKSSGRSPTSNCFFLFRLLVLVLFISV